MFKHNSFIHIITPHLIAILFVMLNISDILIVGIPKTMPLFDLMIIFYFAVFRNFFSIWFVFLLGIWSDALNGDPLGLTALCYILLIKFFVTLNNRMMLGENFRQIWQQFIAFCFLFLLIKWIMLSVFNQTSYSVIAPLTRFVLSSVFYVVMHKFLDYLSNKLSENN